MKTKQELDDLKANWKGDPCWDIEDTEGFEEHHDELLAWRTEYEREWHEKENARLQKKADELGCSVMTVKQIEFLEFRIGQLEKRQS